MAGLSLSMGGYGGIGTAVPAAASAPGASTVGQAAFGITATGVGGARTAGYGALLISAAAAVLLVCIWNSLPR